MIRRYTTMAAVMGFMVLLGGGCLRDRLNPYDPLSGNYQGPNHAPVIYAFTCDPAVTAPGDTTTLTVTATDGDENDRLSYAYTFTEGDGSIAGTGKEVTATIDTVGSHVVKVTVTDGNGGKATKTLDLSLDNIAPTISGFVNAPAVSSPGDTTVLTVTASDADGDSLSYAYAFTQGTGTISGSGSSVTATVNGVGTNTVTVTVSDGHNGEATMTLDLITTQSWFDVDWTYRKKLHVSNPVSDYQMEITVHHADGFDDPANGRIDCEGHGNADFSDLRFVGTDDTTVYDYYIERKTDGDQAVVWVETAGDTEFYLYYGNGSAGSQSNGPDTFPDYFDHWTADNTGDFHHASGSNVHGWTNNTVSVTQGCRYISVGYIAGYTYGGWDYSHFGMCEDPNIRYYSNSNLVSLWFAHKSGRPPDNSHIWIRFHNRVAGSTKLGNWKSVGSISGLPTNTLKFEITHLAGRVAYEVTDLDTDTVLATAEKTDPEWIPAVSNIKHPFVGGLDVSGGNISYSSPTHFRWRNYSSNGSMDFRINYWFIAKGVDPAPSWGTFDAEEAP